MARKLSKEAYNYVMDTIRENGSMSTDEVVELVRRHYDFDPRTARERELRRYVGQLVRSQRDSRGTRTMFLEKSASEIVDIDHCKDIDKVSAVATQLRQQAAGAYRSYRKAAMREKVLNGQVSMFDEMEFFRSVTA